MTQQTHNERRLSLNRIDELRREVGMNLRDFALQVGCSETEASKILVPSSDLHLSHLSRIASALGVPVDKLVVDKSSALISNEHGNKLLGQIREIDELVGNNEESPIKRLTTRFSEQLAELLPNLMDSERNLSTKE